MANLFCCLSLNVDIYPKLLQLCHSKSAPESPRLQFMGIYRLFLLHLHSRNPALEIASLLEWEHQRALIIHLG